MPQNTTVQVTTNWTPLTDADVTSITFQNRGSLSMEVIATPNATAPLASDVGVIYDGGQGEANRLLADLFPGVTAPRRLWARADSGTRQVFVSHA